MKTLLITGSASGIGYETAKLAKERGYQVILHDKDNSKNLQKSAKELGCSYTFFDVANKEEVCEAISEVNDEVGGIDLLVNNAGTTRPNHIEDIDDDEVLAEFKVNVLGPIHCVQAVLPYMKKHGGAIVSLASFRGLNDMGGTGSLTYSQTKAAIVSMTASLAKELAKYNIRVNAIAPGYTNTAWSKNWSKASRNNATEGNLLKRIGEPEDMAKGILYLLSEDASFVTGEILRVDGGYCLSGK